MKSGATIDKVGPSEEIVSAILRAASRCLRSKGTPAKAAAPRKER